MKAFCPSVNDLCGEAKRDPVNTVLHNLIIICIIWLLQAHICFNRVIIVRHLTFTILFVSKKLFQ